MSEPSAQRVRQHRAAVVIHAASRVGVAPLRSGISVDVAGSGPSLHTEHAARRTVDAAEMARPSAVVWLCSPTCCSTAVPFAVDGTGIADADRRAFWPRLLGRPEDGCTARRSVATAARGGTAQAQLACCRRAGRRWPIRSTGWHLAPCCTIDMNSGPFWIALVAFCRCAGR